MKKLNMKSWPLLLILPGIAAALLSLPGPSQAQDAPAIAPMMIEDFEAAPLGRPPYLWKVNSKNASGSKVGAVLQRKDGKRIGKALKFDYRFGSKSSSTDYLAAGPERRALPGNMLAITTTVTGDGSGNAIFLRLRDRTGERFDYFFRVTWSDARQVTFKPLPAPKGSVGGNRNGKLDFPISFDRVGVRRVTGAKREGEITFAALKAIVKYPSVNVLYDVTKSLDQAAWRAVGSNSNVHDIGNQTLKLDDENQAVLKMGYSYNEGDASVEYRRTMRAGDGHGTFIMRIYGDSSNNVLRFRAQDGGGRVFQATIPTILVDWAGWKTIYIDTRTLRDPNAVDPDEVMSNFPVSFRGIVVDDVSGRDQLPGVESGRTGELFLAQVLFANHK